MWTPKKIAIAVIIIVVVVFGIVVYVQITKAMKNAAEKQATLSAFRADEKNAAALAAQYPNVDKDRLQKLFNIAETVYGEMRSWWTNGDTVISLLKYINNADEAFAISDYYYSKVAENKYHLKTDINAHVYGGTSDIPYFEQIT